MIVRMLRIYMFILLCCCFASCSFFSGKNIATTNNYSGGIPVELSGDSFVFDSGLRRIILSFDDNKCKLEQYAKDKKGKGIMESSLISAESEYFIIKDSLLVLRFSDSVNNEYDLSNYYKTLKDKSHIYNNKSPFWNHDYGEVPCIDTLRILLLGDKNKILIGNRNDTIKGKYYLGTDQEVIVNYFFIYLRIENKEELKKDKMNYW